MKNGQNGLSALNRHAPSAMREERLQIMLNVDELRAVDTFRFQNRMPSRAAAVRELFRRGLAAVGAVASEGIKSSDYGVLGQHKMRE
jgi:hypothetical protein